MWNHPDVLSQYSRDRQEQLIKEAEKYRLIRRAHLGEGRLKLRQIGQGILNYHWRVMSATIKNARTAQHAKTQELPKVNLRIG